MAAAAVLAGSAGLTVAMTGPARASSSLQQQSAGLAAGFLTRQIGADGAVQTVPYGGTAAVDNPGDTVRAALGLAVAGHGDTAFRAAVSYLGGHVDAYTKTGASTSSGAAGLLSVVAVAAGASPTSFGTGPTDLVARIRGTQLTSGSDNGEYVDGGYPGVFNHSLALLGLAAARVPAGDTSVAAALNWLEAQQCTGGGFQNAPRGNGSAACTDSTGDTQDPETTAYAVQALAAYGVSSESTGALAYLHRTQHADAGWGSYGAGDGSESDSTGNVGAGLAALGVDPDGPAFAVGTATPAGFLRSTQRSRSATSTVDGAYGYDTESADDFDDVYGTEEALPGELGTTLPLGRVVLTDDAPRAPLPTAGPTTSPTASPAATPTAPGAPGQPGRLPPGPVTGRGSAASACVQVSVSRSDSVVVPAGCVRRPAGATPCSFFYAPRTFRLSVRPVGCLPLAAARTPCNVTYDRHGRKSVLPARCVPVSRRR